MNEFLDRVIFDNSVRMYFTVAGVILFIILVKRFIAHYLAGLLFRAIRAIWKNIDKKTFTISSPGHSAHFWSSSFQLLHFIACSFRLFLMLIFIGLR